MVSEKDVLDALRTVAGPDGRTSVSRTNGIAGLTIREGKVYLALTGDPRLAAAMETMRAEVEKAIKAVPGVTSAVISLTAEMPPGGPGTPKPHAAALRRLIEDTRLRTRLAEAALEECRALYSWSVVGRTIMELYARLAGTRPATDFERTLTPSECRFRVRPHLL